MQMYKENASLQNHYPLKNKIKWITHVKMQKGNEILNECIIASI